MSAPAHAFPPPAEETIYPAHVSGVVCSTCDARTAAIVSGSDVRYERCKKCHPAPPRPAEEVAREMVRETPDGDVQFVDGSTGFSFVGWYPIESETDVDCAAALRSAFASVITSAREDGAAAERARFAPLLQAAHRWLTTMSDAGGSAEEQMAADIELTEAVEALSSVEQQPRDLAGRIRALIQRKAGEWADETDAGRADAYDEALRTLLECLRGVRDGVPGTVDAAVYALRREFKASVPHMGEPLLDAADELEAIVRECGENR